MFKFGEPLVIQYSEANQPNPLRWEMLYKEDDTLIPQAAIMKCKDYFNDVVSKYNDGPQFRVYGFDVSTVKLNDDGQWIRVSNLKPNFFDNIKNIINPFLEKEGLPPIQYWSLPANRGVLFIPREFYNTTYRISLLTQMIRLGNYGELFSSYDHMFSPESPFCTTEHRTPWAPKVLSWKFSPPSLFNGFWWYAGEKYNSKTIAKDNNFMGSIHDNGFISWQQRA